MRPVPPSIQHVFVLTLENRSFDHMFGFSGLSGPDAEQPGSLRTIDGLTGDERNTFGGKPYPVTRGASFVMPADPGHEFPHVLEQLCGPGAQYSAPYPAIHGGGFVDSYLNTGGAGAAADPAEIMKCFDTATELPVLCQLAREFALCDRWFAAMPGPTWPNRMFFHAGSSAGLDHSPTTPEIVGWELADGFTFPRGHVFESLKAKGVPYHLYSGDAFPMVAALKGIQVTDVHRIDALVADLQKPSFPYAYVFIEPSYDVLGEYRHGDSQHPMGDVRRGEALVKRVYEALRASAIWESSLLVVVWDEHGGFYDHVLPPAATPPGDAGPGSKYNTQGFTFAQHGVRVPALVISPFVPRGTIDHRQYDHASIPATLQKVFGLAPLTARDEAAATVLPLLSLGAPRGDTPSTLCAPAGMPVARLASTPAVARPDDPADADNLPSILYAAVRQDLQLAPERKDEILKRVASLKTRQDVSVYLAEVSGRLGGATVAPDAPSLHPR
jgi:phospholipase C